MRFGLNVPNVGALAEPSAFLDLATTAEAAGWDGLFVWDHLVGMPGAPVSDPWTLLAGAATVTERIRLGTHVTPLARRRPWQVARQVTTLDHLSGGRMVLGVGLGEPPEHDFAPFGEITEARARAERLDEGLEVVAGLWTGASFTFEGAHYQVRDAELVPRPVQEPRPPIWVGAMWPNRAPLRRAARWDGVIPMVRERWDELRGPTPEELAEMVEVITPLRESEADALPVRSFDVVFVIEGAPASPGLVEEARDAGATWWQMLPVYGGGHEEFLGLVRQGPPGA